MSNGEPSEAISCLSSYQEGWAEGICQVLKQVSAIDFNCAFLPAEEVEENLLRWAEAGHWVRFGAARQLVGEQAFLVPRESAIQLAHLLMGGPANETVDFGGDQCDALEELLRQFAGATASCWISQQREQVEFPFLGSGPPAWVPAAKLGFRLTSAQTSPLVFGLVIQEELAGAIMRALLSNEVEPSEDSLKPPERVSRAEAAAEQPLPDIELELLLKVELPAALRFGRRQLLLRDVAEFGPGSVVELEQPFDQLAELVINGKVVARGEVVIVDGNYGLQITEISSPRQRLASLSGDRARPLD